MTYAYLKKYSMSTDKRGFYIDGPSWTLQTSNAADRFFRQSTQYHDDTQLPLTVVKTMVHLEETNTGGRKRKAEILDWFPYLNPDYCDMSSEQLNDLMQFVIDCADDDQAQAGSDLMEFLSNETPIQTTEIKQEITT